MEESLERVSTIFHLRRSQFLSMFRQPGASVFTICRDLSFIDCFGKPASRVQEFSAYITCFTRRLVSRIAKISPFITLSAPVFRISAFLTLSASLASVFNSSQLLSMFQQALCVRGSQSLTLYHCFSASAFHRIRTDLSFSHCFGKDGSRAQSWKIARTLLFWRCYDQQQRPPIYSNIFLAVPGPVLGRE
jgi:hypothetical protein